jgi:acyl CoA:acetate/3-ketoacid CoA transferase alpha subunit/acyl CoA:acetate/3-ketoacid CoA transferase beta subunit
MDVAGSKVMEFEHALDSLVAPGDHIHLAYSQARPICAVTGLVRRFAGTDPAFTISTGGLVSSQAALVSEGLVSRLIGSFIGDNYPNAAPNAVFQRAIDSGAVALDETSLWTVFARLMAGALGVPFLPVRSLAGSDLARQDWVGTAVDPFTGVATTVVRALVPDVTIAHGVAADEDGNVILAPPYGETSWGSLAARKGVIATVESIVDRQTIRRYQSLVTIPSHQVQVVCELPFGAHPYGLYSPIPEVSGYTEDEPFILEQRRTCVDPDAHRDWVRTWIHEVTDHSDYLRRLGTRRLAMLAGGAATGVWKVSDEALDQSSPATVEERMVLEAARLIEDRVRSGRSNLIMTGIGFAHLAAWLANRRLAGDGVSAPLMAEIGAYGYQPAAGDPFIFSQRNLPTCTWMTDVAAILGSIVHAGTSRTIAALGAGAIDAGGNMNSSRGPDDGYLVGSGGANDIATMADDVLVVVKHGRSRLVPKVGFVTCPGDRVSTIVTTKAVLQRDADSQEFVLTAVAADDACLDEAVRDAVDSCGWPLKVAPEVTTFAPVDIDQLTTLRSFDPRHAFLPDARARAKKVKEYNR